jgi:hypothetical protein
MAEAALVEEMQVPNGGIADFVMSDEDIETVYGPDEDGAEEYGTEGLGQFTDVANQMAAKGRYGDDLVAHVESGELVIPKDFLDRDPELKRSLFKYLEDHGVEDPERYVVGSKANSINPETGMPEFFFKKLKKAVKKVAKTVSKVAKPVVKIIQKAAPIVLPIALSMTPLGPVFGAALGSGIASLINGGSIKDAFKSALISGAMGAAGAGVSGMMSGQGFMAGVGQAVSNPMARLGQTFTGAQNSLTRLVGGEVAANAPGFFSSYVPTTDADLLIQDLSTPDVLPKTTEPVTTAQAMQSAQSAPGVTPASYSPTQDAQAFANAQFDAGAPGYAMSDSGQILYKGQAIPSNLSSAQTLDPAFSSDFASSAYNFETPYVGMPPGGTTVGAGSKLAADSALTGYAPDADLMIQDLATPDINPPVQPYQRESMLESLSKGNVLEAFDPTRPTTEQVTLARTTQYNDTLNQAKAMGVTDADARKLALAEASKITAESMAPGLLNRAARLAVPAMAGLALTESTGITNLTKTPEQEPPGLIRRDADGNIIDSGEYYIERDPSKYLVGDTTARYADYASYVDPTQYRYDIFGARSAPGGPFVRAADGGAIFPRRNGGIMPDEGTPGKDSVRAMLMPGEFVMTTDAVRGAGGGNLNRGINNMYTVMRNLESRGRRMA